MEDQKLNRVFDRVKLSPEREEAMLADLLREKKEVSSMKQTTRRRIPAAALAAAALMVVLAGTALAAEYFGRITVEPIEGSYENGYTARSDTANITLEDLSEEFLNHAAEVTAAGEDWDILSFDSWSVAETFFGIQTAKNPALAELEPGEVGAQKGNDPIIIANCIAYADYFNGGLPSQLTLKTSYVGDGYSIREEADVCIKASETNQDIPLTRMDVSGVSTGAEQYVTPGGLETVVVKNVVSGGPADHPFCYTNYAAHFVLNNITYKVIITANGGRDDVDALSVLKEVLDAYQ